MILDVPMPGLAGWDEAVSGFWHIGFIQAPGELAEKLVVGRQAAFLGFTLDIAKFTAAERASYFEAYGESQLHAAFKKSTAPSRRTLHSTPPRSTRNQTPLVVAVGEKSFFGALLPKFVEGYRAKGMARHRQRAHSERLTLRHGGRSSGRRRSHRALRAGGAMIHSNDETGVALPEHRYSVDGLSRRTMIQTGAAALASGLTVGIPGTWHRAAAPPSYRSVLPCRRARSTISSVGSMSSGGLSLRLKNGWSQGVPLDRLQQLVDYWRTSTAGDASKPDQCLPTIPHRDRRT